MKNGNRFSKTVAWILSMAIVMQLVPEECYSANGYSYEGLSGKQLDEIYVTESEGVPQILAEVSKLRQEKVKHFINDDRSFSAVAYLDPVHFELNGEMEDIDNTLTRSVHLIGKEKESGYRPKQSPIDVFFKECADQVYLVDKGYQISWSYHQFMSENRMGRIKKVESSLFALKSGLFSTITSTVLGIFRR